MILKSFYIRSKPLYAAIAAIASFTVGFLFYLLFFNFNDSRTKDVNSIVKDFRKISKIQKINQDPIVIYPQSLVMDKDQVTSIYGPFMDVSEDALNMYQHNGITTGLTNQVINQEYHAHRISIYQSSKNLSGRISDCKSIINEVDISISEPKVFENNIEFIIRKLIDQLENDSAISELKGFFKDDILQKHIEEKSCDKHWYKFAGSSVFLKDFGVHLMISRMVYSPTLLKKNSVLSLIYAQVYNEDWEELTNIELILPNFDNGEPKYEKMRFPRFLETPFFHDSKVTGKRWYGPEDARMLLITNEHNMEEPMIIFNAFHRKINENRDEKVGEPRENKKLFDNESKDNTESKDNIESEYNYYRSMFMNWPLRTQKGKVNVDGVANEAYDSVTYNKVAELRRSNTERLKVQKNWTPFTSVNDKKIDGYNMYMYFIYEWDNLKVLKCPINDLKDDISYCDFAYRRNKDEGTVGPLRGGTELISIKDLYPNKEIIAGGEAWVGIARAHIKKCGCGSSMYRPNLVVISRDNGNFKVTDISSFFSFDIDVIGWKIPENKCMNREPSVLIPNGISTWNVITKMGGRFMDNDYVGITLSGGDSADYIIYVKNLLKTVWNNMNIEEFGKNNIYTNDPVSCALQRSKEFCSEYGSEISKIKKKKEKEDKKKEQAKKKGEEKKAEEEKKKEQTKNVEEEKKAEEEKKKEQTKNVEEEKKAEEEKKKEQIKNVEEEKKKEGDN